MLEGMTSAAYAAGVAPMHALLHAYRTAAAMKTWGFPGHVTHLSGPLSHRTVLQVPTSVAAAAHASGRSHLGYRSTPEMDIIHDELRSPNLPVT